MRDAMSLTDQAIAFGEGKVLAADVRAMLGTLDHGQVYDVLHALIEGDAKALLEAVRHLAEQGPDWNGVLSEILNVLHRVAIAQALPEGVDNGHGDRDRVLALAQALPAEDVQFYYQMGLIGRRDLPLAPDPRGGFEMVLLRMLAFRPADTEDAPRQPLKPVGISQATVDSANSVAAAPIVAPVVAAAVVPVPVAPVVAPAPVPAVAPEPVALVAVPEPEPVVEPVAVEEVVDLPWNDPVEPEVVQQPAVEPMLETAGEQPELPPMPMPTPDSVVPDAPEWAAAPIPEPSVAEVDAATPGIDLDDEPPLDEDYIEPDMDSAYSYLDDLASEHTAEPAAQPEPEPAAMPATGLALQWLELFPKLPVSGMTGSIAANCTLIAVDGDNWLLHLDPAHSALFNATQQRRLNDALNQHHGRTLTLSIELIKPEQETPAQAASRRRADRQREAEESIHGDPFIQQMMQQFGAVVRHDTIEPVEALVSQG
jgi:DNA polymerase-3 subunit gamma/tau